MVATVLSRLAFWKLVVSNTWLYLFPYGIQTAQYLLLTRSKISFLCTSLIVLIGGGVLIKKVVVQPPLLPRARSRVVSSKKHYLISFKITMLVSINGLREYFRSTVRHYDDWCDSCSVKSRTVGFNEAAAPSRAGRQASNTTWIFMDTKMPSSRNSKSPTRKMLFIKLTKQI